jgi:hypothetical protein
VLQVVDTNANPVPEMDAAVGTVMPSVEDPVLVSVEVKVADVFAVWLPNAMFDTVANWVWPVP